MDTTYDLPDWESQAKEMFGDDADDLIRTFKRIIEEHEASFEPVASVELLFSQDEVHRDLPQLKAWLDGQPCDEQTVRNLMWTVGMELCRQYMTNDEVEYDEPCSDTIPYFFGSEDDFSGETDDEADDDGDDDPDV